MSLVMFCAGFAVSCIAIVNAYLRPADASSRVLVRALLGTLAMITSALAVLALGSEGRSRWIKVLALWKLRGEGGQGAPQ